MKEKIINYFKNKDNCMALLSIGIYCAIMYGLVELIYFMIKHFFKESFIASNINGIVLFINVFIYIILFAALIPISLKKIKNDWFISRNNTAGTARYIVIGIIVMYGASFIASLISIMLSSQTSTNQDSINSIINHSKLFYWIMFPIIGFIGPICEELVFRHSIFKLIKNDTISLIVSSILFCLIHMDGQAGGVIDFIAVAINYLASGLALGFTYIYSKRNITITIFIHVLNNVVSLLMLSIF